LIPSPSSAEPAIHFVTRLLIAAYLVEAGIVLIVGPWTRPWERNYFAFYLPWLGDLMSNAFVRGAVTGVGLITIVAGLRELTGAFLARGTTEEARDEPDGS